MFLFLILFSVPALAAELTVQTSSNATGVTAGSQSPFVLTVLVLDRNGIPENTLGGVVGNGSSVITLPEGWSISYPDDQITSCSGLGADHIVPTLFANRGDGAYTIQIKPNSALSCMWDSGSAHYVVRLQIVRDNGAGLGQLDVP